MCVETKDLKKTENTGTSFIRNSSFQNMKKSTLKPFENKTHFSFRNFPLINIHKLYLIFKFVHHVLQLHIF